MKDSAERRIGKADYCEAVEPQLRIRGQGVERGTDTIFKCGSEE